MKILYVELEEGKSDGPAMTYSELVDGLNENALVMVEAKEVAQALEMLNNIINNMRSQAKQEFPQLTAQQIEAVVASRFGILSSSGKPQLIKADLGSPDER